MFLWISSICSEFVTDIVKIQVSARSAFAANWATVSPPEIQRNSDNARMTFVTANP